MTAHAERGHSQWSASSTERNWQCPGSLALTDGLPETTSEAADWGTACHQIAEKCLRGNGPADRYIGTTEKGKSHSFEVDEEMAETAQMYVDYVVSVLDQEGDDVMFFVEQKFSLAALKPPFDAGGTADAVIYLSKMRQIEVIDLKGGRGVVVEATGNPQGRTYALGAMLARQDLAVDTVKVTIVQPRAPHKDGRIRSETFHIADLVEWTTDLVAAMRKSHDAIVAASAILSRRPEEDAGWWSYYLKAGDHCKFCKAKPTCPAIEKAVLDQVGLWFDDLDQPRLANVMSGDDPAQISRDLDALDMIESWVNARRERAHQLAEAGIEIPNYILVPKQGREKWNDGAEEQVIGAALVARLPEAKYLNPGKLRTPKQIRKELGKQASLVDGLSSTPETGTNLVRHNKTSREPVQGTASRFFDASA